MAVLGTVRLGCDACGAECYVPVRTGVTRRVRTPAGQLVAETVMRIDQSMVDAFTMSHRAVRTLQPGEPLGPVILGVSRSWP